MKKIVIILLLTLIGCIEKKEGTLSKDEILNFRSKALKSGDRYSYSRLIIHYENINSYELLPCSFVMANKYDNPDAFLEIYQSLIKLNNKDTFKESLILNLQKEESDFILSFLKRGAILNDIDCKVFLAKHYRNGYGLIKNEKKADSIMASIK